MDGPLWAIFFIGGLAVAFLYYLKHCRKTSKLE